MTKQRVSILLKHGRKNKGPIANIFRADYYKVYSTLNGNEISLEMLKLLLSNGCQNYLGKVSLTSYICFSDDICTSPVLVPISLRANQYVKKMFYPKPDPQPPPI